MCLQMYSYSECVRGVFLLHHHQPLPGCGTVCVCGQVVTKFKVCQSMLCKNPFHFDVCNQTLRRFFTVTKILGKKWAIKKQETNEVLKSIQNMIYYLFNWLFGLVVAIWFHYSIE